MRPIPTSSPMAPTSTPLSAPPPTSPLAPEAFFVVGSKDPMASDAPDGIVTRLAANCFAAVFPTGERFTSSCAWLVPPGQIAALVDSRYSLQIGDDSPVETATVEYTAPSTTDPSRAGDKVTTLTSTFAYDEVRFAGLPAGNWAVRLNVTWTSDTGVLFAASYDFSIRVSS